MLSTDRGVTHREAMLRLGQLVQGVPLRTAAMAKRMDKGPGANSGELSCNSAELLRLCDKGSHRRGPPGTGRCWELVLVSKGDTLVLSTSLSRGFICRVRAKKLP